MIFCKDCQFCKLDIGPLGEDWSLCTNPKMVIRHTSLVTGKEVMPDVYCEIARMSHMACGTDGKLFEPIAETHDLPTGPMGGAFHGRAIGRGV